MKDDRLYLIQAQLSFLKKAVREMLG